MKGRPIGAASRQLSRTLLHAASRRLRAKSHLELTCKEIAAEAGTYPAMVNYYFHGKDGLFAELLEEISRDAHTRMQEVENTLLDGGDATRRIVQGLVEAYYPHADVLSVILIEMHRCDSLIKSVYAQRTRQRRWHLFYRLQAVVERLMAAGVYRIDVDSSVVTWTILSLVSGPLILIPMNRVNGGPTALPAIELWIDHITAMLHREFLANAQPNSNTASAAIAS